MYLVIINKEHRNKRRLIEEQFGNLPVAIFVWNGKESYVRLFIEKYQKEHTITAVIAVGGDGTVSAVIKGVADDSIPIGIVPVGTGNLLAKSLNIPLDIRETLKIYTADHLETVPLSTACLGEDRAGLIITTGLHAKNLRANQGWLKKYLGMFSYILFELRSFYLRREYQGELTIDHQPMFTTTFTDIICTNTSTSIIPGLEFAPETHPEGPYWTVCVLRRPRFWESVKNYFLLRKRKFAELRGTTYYRCYSTVTIRSSRRLPYMVDGELCKERTMVMDLRIEPSSRRVIIPSPTSHE